MITLTSRGSIATLLDLATFDLTTFIGREAIAAMSAVAVDSINLTALSRGGVFAEIASARLEAAGIDNPSDWEVVGFRDTDLTRWCEVEGKIEHDHEELLLMVRKTDLQAARAAHFAEQAKSLTHNPFAALLD